MMYISKYFIESITSIHNIVRCVNFAMTSTRLTLSWFHAHPTLDHYKVPTYPTITSLELNFDVLERSWLGHIDRDGKDTQKIPFSVPRFQTELRPRRTISRDLTSIAVVYIGHKLSTEPSFVVYARTEHCQSHCRICVVLMDFERLWWRAEDRARHFTVTDFGRFADVLEPLLRHQHGRWRWNQRYEWHDMVPIDIWLRDWAVIRRFDLATCHFKRKWWLYLGVC